MTIKADEFIQKNIIKTLIQEGYSEPSATHGAMHGVDYYHRASQAQTSKGIFHDCLYHARLSANLYARTYEKRGRK